MFEAEYLIKREQQELDAALRASDLRVRQVHLELADAYTFRLNEAKRLKRLAELKSVAETGA
jgi:hypothetical protein